VRSVKRYVFSAERPRSPMAARGVTPAQTKRSGVSRRHDAGSHSVDRIVRVILFIFMDGSSDLISALE
jgi:hypothetical protein